jgi:hypothetical protein
METRCYNVKLIVQDQKVDENLIYFQITIDPGQNIIEKIDNEISKTSDYIDKEITYGIVEIIEIRDTSKCWGCINNKSGQFDHSAPPFGCLYVKSSSDKSSPEDINPTKQKEKRFRISEDQVEQIDEDDGEDHERILKIKTLEQKSRDEEISRAKKKQSIYNEAKEEFKAFNDKLREELQQKDLSSSSSDLII